MDKKMAEDFVKRNRFCDHSHVVWLDGSEDEFGITLRSEILMEYSSVYEYAVERLWLGILSEKRRKLKACG